MRLGAILARAIAILLRRTTTRATVRVHCSLDDRHHSSSSRIIDIMHNHATPADESRRGDTPRRTLCAARCGAQRFPIVWHPRVHVASHALSSSERLNITQHATSSANSLERRHVVGDHTEADVGGEVDADYRRAHAVHL